MTYTGAKEIQELELQLAKGAMNVIDFLNAVSNSYIPNKEDLIQIIKEKNNGNNNSDL